MRGVTSSEDRTPATLTSYRCKKHLLSRGCVAEIVRRRDIPLTTVSDRDARLYLDAWRSFQLDLGMRVTITTANGLHSDGQSERVRIRQSVAQLGQDQ
ncbi:hypothetical protein OSB04_un000036, partial [Centaurea solstitialis]